MRILVTGGAGFVGSHVTDALLDRGDEVTVLDALNRGEGPPEPENLERARQHGRCCVLHGDIRDPKALDESLQGVDAVIHLAARAGVRSSLRFPALFADINLTGTAQLLQAMKRASVPQLVFASSSSVYGATEGPCREDAPADVPLSPYAATKRGGELLCAAWAAAGPRHLTSLRFFTVYGPRQRRSMAIARFIQAARRDEPLSIFGDGSSTRDYTYVTDVVRAVLAALDRPRGVQVLNVGNGRPVRLDALVDSIARVTGRPVRIEHQPDQLGDVPHTCADPTQAFKQLEWKGRITLEEGLSRYVAWLNRRPSAPAINPSSGLH
ncbi:MAG: NAD-dependent epimerase/dehydratase family protein [Myxococcota bacterium]